MINPYHSRIDIQSIVDLQEFQHQQTLYVEQEVPANSSIDAAVNVTSYGYFMMLFLTGSHTTKTLDGEDVIDDGINHLYLQLIDGDNSRELFTDPVPASIILSPGRARGAAGLGDASEPLRTFYPFVYTFQINGQIIWRVRNDAAFANKVKIAMTGIRIFPQSRFKNS